MTQGDILSDTKLSGDEVVAHHPEMDDTIEHTVEDIVKADDEKKVIEGVEVTNKAHPEGAGQDVEELEEGDVPDPLGHLPELEAGLIHPPKTMAAFVNTSNVVELKITDSAIYGFRVQSNATQPQHVVITVNAPPLNSKATWQEMARTVFQITGEGQPMFNEHGTLRWDYVVTTASPEVGRYWLIKIYFYHSVTPGDAWIPSLTNNYYRVYPSAEDAVDGDNNDSVVTVTSRIKALPH